MQAKDGGERKESEWKNLKKEKVDLVTLEDNQLIWKKENPSSLSLKSVFYLFNESI